MSQGTNLAFFRARRSQSEALGIKAPLDFSVFSAATGAFILSGLDRYKLSLDDRKSEVGSR
jgi:hypothetical protein